MAIQAQPAQLVRVSKHGGAEYLSTLDGKEPFPIAEGKTYIVYLHPIERPIHTPMPIKCRARHVGGKLRLTVIRTRGFTLRNISRVYYMLSYHPE